MEFLLQLQQLRVGVRRSQASGQAVFWNEFSCNWKLHFLFESRGECEFEPGAALDTRQSTPAGRLVCCRQILHSLGFDLGGMGCSAGPGRNQCLTGWCIASTWRMAQLLQHPETRVVIQSISSSPTITNSASRQLRNNFTHSHSHSPRKRIARSSQLDAQCASRKLCLALSFQSEALSN